MKNLSLRNFTFTIVTLTLIIGWGLAIIKGLSLDNILDYAKLIPNIVTIELIIFFVFAKYGWKCKIFKGWLVPYPDLNGTWLGTVQSNWINPETKEKLELIPVMLTIKQTFLSISCVMYTHEMKSYSFSEEFTIDSEKQLNKLSFMYSSEPRIIFKDRSTQHNGATILEIITSPQLKLKGRYWSDRESTGEVQLSFHCDEVLQEIPDDIGKHPLS